NDVPLLYPDIYVSDSIAVHGIQQILTLPIGSLFDEFRGKDTSPTPSPSITQQPIVLAFPAAQTVITDSVSSKDFDSINGGFHGKDTSPSPPSSITKQPIAAAAIPAGQTVMIDSESSSDSNSMFDDYHGKNVNDYD
ncbi:hypothetical protein MKW98_017356, partial [Papaver atlanticum]